MRKHQFPWCQDKFMSQSMPLPNVGWKNECLFLHFQTFTSQQKKNLILVKEIIQDLQLRVTEIKITALTGFILGKKALFIMKLWRI